VSIGGPRGDRLLEILAVVLLGIATVGTAWCGFQSSMWNGIDDDSKLAATQARIESSRIYNTSTTAAAYDATMVARYAEAYRADDKKLMAFYRRTLVRKEFLPVLDRWVAMADRGQTPPNLMQDKQYLELIMGPYQKAEARTAELDAASDSAGTIANTYVLMTLLLAMALFFAGVTSSFRYPVVRLMLLAACMFTIAIAAIRIVDLPIASTSWDFFTK
jgi:hypothetical protein